MLEFLVIDMDVVGVFVTNWSSRTLGVNPFKRFRNFQKDRNFTCKQKVVLLFSVKSWNLVFFVYKFLYNFI